MTKRYRRKRVKRYRKKRIMRRRRFRKSSKYDGQVEAKIRMIGYVQHNASGHADFTIEWGNDTGPLANSYCRIQDSSEWQFYRDNYLQWRIVGVKMEYQPLNIVTGGNNASAQFMTWYSTSPIDNLNRFAADDVLKQNAAFESYPSNRQVKKYVNLAKFWKKQGLEWQNSNVAYPPASSIFRIFSTGYADGASVGTMDITYYMRARGLRV